MSNRRKEILAQIKAGTLSPEVGLAMLREPQPVAHAEVDGPRALQISGPGDIADLRVVPAAQPALAATQVRIAVHAFALNFGDWLCVRGLYPTMPDYPFTPGFEVAGTLLECGAQVRGFKPGDAVVALMDAAMGGHAEVVVTEARNVARKPRNLSFEEACSLPVAFLTAWYALERANLARGERILIQTAAGGTGLMAVQLAKARGAEIYGTAGSAEKLAYLAQIGVAHPINYEEQDFAAAVQTKSQGRGVDVVLNTLSGDAIQKGLNLLAPEGRYVEIAMTGLKTSQPLDLSGLVDNQTVISIDLRRLGLKRPEVLRRYLDEMVVQAEKGAIKPTVSKVFDFDDAHQAYHHLRQRANIGKVVVRTKVPQAAAAARPPATAPVGGDIAIIGMAGRFPDADNVDAFWENLKAGVDSVREVPRHRWNAAEVYDPKPGTPGKTYCKWGGFIDRVDLFDPLFFNMSGREAELADPQQRLFLESCFTALEDAAYSDTRLADSACGVFVGASSGDYLQRMIAEGLAPEAQTFIGNAASILAARIAYFLNLKGPSIAVDTACSSSLVALHLACQSLAAGECELALAGGVFLMNTAHFHLLSARSEMLSADGRCKTFDDGANGFVPGEGVGALVLKPLAKALADGDRIHAVIEATALNQDGRTNGITAPSSLSQSRLESEAWRKAGIRPDELSYIEAHGTGTALGDPIEIEALTRAFHEGGATTPASCAIGSVKTNIGHLAMAAGVAGIIKILQAMRHQMLPPSLHFHQPNRYIDFDASPFRVVTKTEPWQVPAGRPRRATVSSFGFSGTNCHVVLREAPAQTPNAQAFGPQLIALSAVTTGALKQRIADLAAWLDQHADADLARVAYTLNGGRAHYARRAAFVAHDGGELRTSLRAWLTSPPATPTTSGDPDRDQALTDLLQGAADAATLQQAAAVYQAGATPDWRAIYGQSAPMPMSLPHYPFERDSYWIFDESPEPQAPRLGDNLLWLPRWHHEPIQNQAAPSGACWLVYPADARPLAQALAERLSAAGRTVTRLVLGDRTSSSETALTPADDNAAEQWLQQQATPLQVLFLAGTHNPLDAVDPVAAVKYCQTHGVLAAHTLMRVLAKRAGEQPLHLSVITQNGCAPAGGRLNPGYTALHGWAKSLARELPAWHVAILDIDAAESDIPATHAAMLNETGAGPLEVAYRAGTRWVRRIARVNGCPQAASPPWRARGVYVIAGGAGGIGHALSLHLARTVGARLCWLGRRTEDDAIRANIEAVRNAGGDAVYVSADIRETDQVQAALATCRARFGPIHGVIHGAIVMDDAPLNQCDNRRFSAVLDTKSLGALNLHLATQNDPIDKVVYLSSFNAWTGNHGQANYSAGCTFKDAFGAALNARGGAPVTVIDWGFWGEVGIVATDHYRRRLAEAGIEPISTGDGLTALEAVTAAGIHHAMVIRADQALQPLLVEPQLTTPAALPAPHGLTPSELLAPLPQSAHQRQLAGACQGAEELDAFCRLRLLAKMREMGFGDRVGERVDTEHLRRHWRVQPKMAALFDALLFTLRESGWLVADGDGLRVAPTAGDADLLQRVATQREQAADLVRRFPALKPHLALLEAGVSRLDAILSGALPATEALFPNGSPELVQAIYQGNPYADFHNQLCAAAIATYLRALRAQDPERTLRVIEIGAGTGGTTSAVIPALRDIDRLEYRYTDIGAAFTRYGRDRFGHEPFMAFSEFDLDRDPVAQGLALQDYDLVLAANVVHATADIQQSLLRLKQLLRPGGWLVLYEVVALTPFNTLTFGLLDGWWPAADPALRLTHSPLLDPARWRLAAASVGLNQAWCGGLPDVPEAAWQQAIIVAQADLTLPQALPAKAAGAPAQAPSAPSVAAPTPAAAGADVRDVTRRLKRLLAETLKIKENHIEDDQPYTDLGVDSLIAVELIEVITKHFGVELRTTDLFNYGTLAQLGRHVADSLPAAAPVAQPTPTAPVQTAPTTALQAARDSHDDAVAIVGMSARFADRDTPDALWAMLADGRHAIGDLPQKRWQHTDNRYQGAFIPDLERFDSLFFGISPLEARHMDPQQRICLESVWHAFEDAGLDVTTLPDRNVGVYVGCSGNSYLHGIENSLGAIGNSIAVLSGRISYLLNLRGPNLAIDTACSSSLVAIHSAVEAIQRGACETAVAAGVSALLTSPDMFLFFKDSGMASPTARCRTFDRDANGFVPGEGVAAVVLMPLRKAVAEGHQVYGVVRASAVNQDGRTNGITAPSAPSQAELLQSIYRPGGIDPNSIDYVEAHGTGTKLGDPIEVQALTQAFGQRHGDKCWLGSVKTNLGHTLAAAGIAGLVKVLLAMRHETLPPSLHFDNENPHIGFADTPFRVCDRATPWPRGSRVRRAAVSSFGFSGTNCHLVVEEGPVATVATPDQPAPYLFPLAAKSPTALIAACGRLVSWLDQHASVHPGVVAANLNRGRADQPVRRAWVAADLAELRTLLQEAVRGGEATIVLEEGLSDATRDLLAAQVAPTQTALHDAGTNQSERRRYLSLLADLYQRGIDINRQALSPAVFPRLSLPGYPFAPTPHWLDDQARFGLAANQAPAAAPARDQNATWDAVVARLHETAACEGARLDLSGAADFRRLGRLMLWRSLSEMGGLDRPGQRINRAQLAESWGVIPKYRRLYSAILNILADEGFARLEGDWVVALDAAALTAVNEASRTLPQKRADFLANFADMAPYVTLLETCVGNLPKIISGRVPATDIMFPNSSLHLVEGIYRGNRVMDYYNQLLAAAVAEITETTLAALPAGEKVHILEAGAGTGGSSAFVLEALRPFADRVVYWYTDLSVGFMQHAKQRFVPQYPFVEPHLFNVEAHPATQGVPLGHFHIAFATNALHATADMRRTMTHLGATLAPGAWMMVNELTKVQDFGTLTFGLLDGWWLYEDEDIRLTDSPLLGLNEWSRLFDDTGFGRFAAFGRPGEGDQEAVQHVVLTRYQGQSQARQSKPIAAKPTVAETPAPQAATPSTPTAGGDMITRLRTLLSDVLEVPLNHIRPDTPYQDIGVDSIMAVKIIEQLNEAEGIELETTDLFNYPNIKALAAHIKERFPNVAQPKAAAARAPAVAPAATPDEPMADMLARLRSGSVSADALLNQIQKKP